MRADLLDGATRVLETRGAAGFTTNHVARATGASIGSLYQYFPDKAAVLGELHDRDAVELWSMLRDRLLDKSQPRRERFVHVVMASCRAQANASELHTAMGHAEMSATSEPNPGGWQETVHEGLTEFLGEQYAGSDADELARFVWLILSAVLAEIAVNPERAERLAAYSAEMLATQLRL